MRVGGHRRHDPQVGVGLGIGGGKRLELPLKHVHVGAQRAQATQAKRGVRLVFGGEERQRLVGAASSMRITTFLPGNWASSSAYALVCSSTLGGSALPMNRNSERNRPTPSAPYSSAVLPSEGLPTLASSGMW